MKLNSHFDKQRSMLSLSPMVFPGTSLTPSLDVKIEESANYRQNEIIYVEAFSD